MNNPNIIAVFAALRGVLIALGTLLVALNLGETQVYVMVIKASGLVMVVGPIAWAVFEKLVTLKKSLAAAVQAGINLTISGKAVDHDGAPISKFAADATPPQPVTVASSTEIIKEFAPSTASISKS